MMEEIRNKQPLLAKSLQATTRAKMKAHEEWQ